MLTGNMGRRGRQADGMNQERRGNAQRRARQNSDWGSGFGSIDSDDNQ